MSFATGRGGYARLIGLATTALVVLILFGFVPQARADFAGRNGRLVFQRNGDLYTILSNGTGLHRLTTQGGSTPRWSRDGRRIVFVRGTSIWVMSADGSGQHRVAEGWGPTFSPDGKSLAFVHPVRQPKCPPDGGGWGKALVQQITVMSLDHPAASRTLYSDAMCQNADWVYWVTSGIRWSPDGKRLLFNEHYNSEHTSASSLVEVTIATKKWSYLHDFICWDESAGGGIAYCPYQYFDFTLDMQPDYSPSGDAVVFISDIRSGNPQISGIASTGKYLTYVGGDSYVHSVVWSPDGKQWAYVQRAPGAVPVIKITPASLTPEPAKTIVVNGAQVDWQPLH